MSKSGGSEVGTNVNSYVSVTGIILVVIKLGGHEWFLGISVGGQGNFVLRWEIWDRSSGHYWCLEVSWSHSIVSLECGFGMRLVCILVSGLEAVAPAKNPVSVIHHLLLPHPSQPQTVMPGTRASAGVGDGVVVGRWHGVASGGAIAELPPRQSVRWEAGSRVGVTPVLVAGEGGVGIHDAARLGTDDTVNVCS